MCFFVSELGFDVIKHINASVAELADALVSEASGLYHPWRFESSRSHQDSGQL
jgi:hypothetical protein